MKKRIGKHHGRKAFDCGNADLNELLHRHARQSHDFGGSKTFLAIDDADGKTILGFYSLAPTSIEPNKVPAKVRQGLGCHEVPGFPLTRLAVDLQGQGQGWAGCSCLPPASVVCAPPPSYLAHKAKLCVNRYKTDLCVQTHKSYEGD